VGALAGSNVPLISVDKTGLTGAGATAVTETTKGVPAGVTEIRKGTFVMPDPANAGYYKAYTGDTIITDGTVGPSGFLMESINVADGDVTEGVLIQGSVLALRVAPAPLAGAVLTAIAGRIVLQ
jgi:DNA/RNA endonuclease YhcR with UshA esterase domain